MRWGLRIQLRDGTWLSATLYLPEGQIDATPCLFAITPHTAHRLHPAARYFASCGYPFLIVDCRGRGNSEGTFQNFIHEGKDGYDVVEWIAHQAYCDGRVAMFGSSYAAYGQWATAKEFPPHLASIIPASACAPAVDFPMRNNICYTWAMHWLTFTVNRTSQDQIALDQTFWRSKFHQWFESGRPFEDLDDIVGNPSAAFQEWQAHACQDTFWDRLKPNANDYANLDLPILTLTGSYDADQPGALHYYREHLKHASPAAGRRHYLVIGPWDVGAVLAPKCDIAGIKVGPAAIVDVLALCLAWYDWTLRDGPPPAFLKNRVSYYVMGAEQWRFADSLEDISSGVQTLYLHSTGDSSKLLSSGTLEERLSTGGTDSYIYDPRDLAIAAVEAKIGEANAIPPLRPTFATDSLTDQTVLYANDGNQLIYHSRPFDHDTEISGFFNLKAWISIDQPDTDFIVRISEIEADGHSTLLTTDVMRARFRENQREETLIKTTDPLLYEFNRFTFIARVIATRSRLRLVIGPINSIFIQKNFNSGGVVSKESVKDARPVTVTLWHGPQYPSAICIPLG